MTAVCIQKCAAKSQKVRESPDCGADGQPSRSQTLPKARYAVPRQFCFRRFRRGQNWYWVQLQIKDERGKKRSASD
jgi:hypothetical protein